MSVSLKAGAVHILEVMTAITVRGSFPNQQIPFMSRKQKCITVNFIVVAQTRENKLKVLSHPQTKTRVDHTSMLFPGLLYLHKYFPSYLCVRQMSTSVWDKLSDLLIPLFWVEAGVWVLLSGTIRGVMFHCTFFVYFSLLPVWNPRAPRCDEIARGTQVRCVFLSLCMLVISVVTQGEEGH